MNYLTKFFIIINITINITKIMSFFDTILNEPVCVSKYSDFESKFMINTEKGFCMARFEGGLDRYMNFQEWYDGEFCYLIRITKFKIRYRENKIFSKKILQLNNLPSIWVDVIICNFDNIDIRENGMRDKLKKLNSLRNSLPNIFLQRPMLGIIKRKELRRNIIFFTRLINKYRTLYRLSPIRDENFLQSIIKNIKDINKRMIITKKELKKEHQINDTHGPKYVIMGNEEILYQRFMDPHIYSQSESDPVNSDSDWEFF